MKLPKGYLDFKKMLLVSSVDNNRWIYMMDGLQKPMDHVSAGGVMAGSVATLAIVWISLQTMGLFGYSNSIGAYKLPISLQNYLPGYNDAPVSGLSSTNYFSGVVDTGLFSHNKPMPRIDEEALNTSISFAQTSIDRMSLLETNIINAGVRLETPSPEHKQYLSSYPLDDAFEKGIDAILLAKASSYLLLGNCRRFGISKDDCARFLSTMKLDGIPFGKTCMAAQNVVCNPKAKYRSIDGSCNNVDNPSWGSAMTAYTRVLFPHYSDGIQTPRHMGDTKKPLPNPRAVSVSLSRPTDQSDVTRTLAVMQWSQFIAHDVSQTPVRKMISTGTPISCCESNGNNLSPRYMHPDCAAIEIPSNDPVYGKNYVRCMNYVRSLPVLKSDCTMGPIEQMNQVSQFLDGSTIYGSTLKKSRKLRTFEKGLLRVNVINNHNYLPYAGIDLASQCKESCYASGDDRINVEPQLAVIHTIWHREHNRIAKELAKLNPEWSDEILYQEARRIVIAEIQHITYNEWLPILLGKTYARATGLYVTPSYSRNYNSDDDPSISNEVATAAFEFLYSLMQGKVRMPDESRQVNNTLELSEYFFKPRVIEADDVFDGLLRGLATQTVQKMDTNVVEAVSSKLFKTNNKEFGLDVISLAIQRGRDHGFPGYNHYRKHCGLPTARKFDDFLDYIPTEMVQTLRTTYSHPNDVDLIIGGLAERPADDGLLGPTFSCIIAEQFARTRRTDRFFYDSAAQPRPFTLDQLIELRNVTLARILCDNGNNIHSMQPNVFIKPQSRNELTSCQDFEAIPSVDLFAWAEKAKAYR